MLHGANTGAGPVYVAGSDEGLRGFLIFHSAGISSNERKGVACFAGCAEVVKSLRQRLQRGRPLFSSCSNMLARDARGGQEHMLSSPPTHRGCMLAPQPFLLAVRRVRPSWPRCSPALAAAWCSWWTRKFFAAASCIRICTCTVYIPKKAIKFSFWGILRPQSASTLSVCGKLHLLLLFLMWKRFCVPG